MSLRSKFLFILISVSFIPFLFIGLLNYANTRQLLVEAALSKVNALKTLKVNQIEDNLKFDVEKLQLVTSRTQMRQLVEDYSKKNNPEDLKKIQKIITDTKEAAENFSEISILNLEGAVIASTNSDLIKTNMSTKSFFIQGKAKDSVSIFSQDQNNYLVHYLSGPLYLDDVLIGVLVIKTNAEHYLSIFTDYDELGQTGESLFVLRDGNNAIFTHPLRFDNEAAFKRKIDLNDLSKPSALALTGQSGVYSDTKDYRGNSVISATHYFKDLDAAIVVKIDKSEALSQIDEYQSSFIIIAFVVLIFTILIVLYLTGSFTKPINELSKAAEKLSQADFTTTTTILNVNSKDEIGRLAEAFRKMTIKLKQSYGSLEEKVKERTSQLNAKIEESERLNKLMVGRELKMIELKKEIEQLKKPPEAKN